MSLPRFLYGWSWIDRGELQTWAADVWPLAEGDPDVIGWAEVFLAARREAAGA
jgi:hypothetical protein